MTGHVQVQGLCRFSYLSHGAFQSAPSEIGARRALLFDERRLDLRLTFFEHVTLPGLRCQTDPDFTLHVLTSEDMPRRQADRLRDLTADIPQVRIVARPVAPHRDMCRSVMMSARDPDAAIVAEFRQDDDDGVAVDFVEQVRNHAAVARALMVSGGRAALDFGRGIVVDAEPGGAVQLRPVVTHLWGCGQALCFHPDDDRSLLDFPHHVLWRQMPVVTLPQPMMYLRGKHGTNDSKLHLGRNMLDLPAARVNSIARSRFRLDIGRFQAALDTLSRHIP